jgi:hypothetical protein
VINHEDLWFGLTTMKCEECYEQGDTKSNKDEAMIEFVNQIGGIHCDTDRHYPLAAFVI